MIKKTETKGKNKGSRTKNIEGRNKEDKIKEDRKTETIKYHIGHNR